MCRSTRPKCPASAAASTIAATPEPIIGLDTVLRLHESLALDFARSMSRLLRCGLINGLPGFVTIERDMMLQTTTLRVENGRITAIDAVQNPDKLRHIDSRAVH